VLRFVTGCESQRTRQAGTLRRGRTPTSDIIRFRALPRGGVVRSYGLRGLRIGKYPRKRNGCDNPLHRMRYSAPQHPLKIRAIRAIRSYKTRRAACDNAADGLVSRVLFTARAATRIPSITSWAGRTAPVSLCQRLYMQPLSTHTRGLTSRRRSGVLLTTKSGANGEART
jgi:hypothetical protein